MSVRLWVVWVSCWVGYFCLVRNMYEVIFDVFGEIMRILLLVYVCLLNVGSEWGVGWWYVVELV